MGQAYHGLVELIVTAGSAGEVVINDSTGKQIATDATVIPPGYNYWIEVTDPAPSRAGSTDQYTVNFYPNATGQALTGQCQQSDGSIGTTGPGGTYHGPAVAITVNWLPAGEGASVSVNGVTVPGSSTYTPVSTATPTMAVTGDVRVGGVVTCAVTPAPTPKVSSWNWQWTAADKSLGYTWPYKNPPNSDPFLIPASAYGLPLRCGGLNNGLDGGPDRIFSAPVTVAAGTMKATQRPIIAGLPKVGHSVYVSPVSWSVNSAHSTSYQWYVGATKIPGATQSHYMVPKQDKGKRLLCRVTGSAYGYAPAAVMSHPSFPIN